MRKSGWYFLPAAFFLYVNFAVSSVKPLFFSRLIYFLFLTFLFLILRRFNLDRIKILPPIVGGISLILFLYGIFQKFFLFPLYLNNVSLENNLYSQARISRIQSGRIFSIFALPTLYAIICALLIIFIFHYLLKTKNNKSKIFWGVLLLLGIFNLLLTQSFGGIIYISAGIFIYLLAAQILKFKYLAPAVMGLALFLFITIGLRFAEAREFEPIKLRFTNWTQAARIIGSSPFWGVGLGNYESKISYYTKADEAESIYAHNFFLQFIAETGMIIPCILLLLLLISGKKYLVLPDRQMYKEKNVYISTFLILLVYNAMDIGFYFFPAGIAAATALSQVYLHPRTRTDNQNQKPIKMKITWKLIPDGMIVIVFVMLSTVLVIETAADCYQKEADSLFSQKQFNEAETSYKKSLKINPFNYRSLVGCARIYILTGSVLKAETLLDQALALHPDHPLGNRLKSELEFKSNHFYRSFYHAAAAYQMYKINNEYRQWYEYLKHTLEGKLKGQDPEPGKTTQ